MKKYALGFIFSANLDKVYLIEKQEPEWQRGRYNGVGGKLEPGENSSECMRRESIEECGYEADDWTYYGVMYQKDIWQVDMFHSVIKKQAEPKMTEEKTVTGVKIQDLKKMKTIKNIPFLVEAALTHINKPEFKINVEYFEN